MKNRRNFFKNLLGLIVAPKVAEVVKIPATNLSYLRYKGIEPIIYAPYIPLLITKLPLLTKEQILTQNLSQQIQNEIDFSILKNLETETDASLIKTIEII
jgi:hypothetical protein